MSHNGRDKPIVERAAERLKRAGLEPWLDKWALTPGGRWQEELAAGIRASSACAYFVGPNGEGDWEREELGMALSRAAKDRTFRLFPVLLPGVAEPFERTTLPPFLATRTWVDLRGGLDDTRGVQALINAIKGVPLGPAVPLAARDDVSPYRGLQTFDEEDATLFFGREGDVQAILEQLKASSFLAVLGPSGSGKSSIVRAGVIPALRRGTLAGSSRWLIAIVRPGSRPLESLATRLVELDPREAMQRTVDELERDERTLHLAGALALAREPEANRIVWIIDQAEELFALDPDQEQRTKFIANLVYAASIPGGSALAILTLRADFYERCAAYPALAALLARHQYLVAPMDEEDLRAAIEEPARAVGLEFESGLVDTILEDVGTEPGTLPLLEHALLELWERRRGGMLTLEAYRESGGVQGAIAQRAETIYNAFDVPRQAIVRQVLLRLTQPGSGTEDTRRRATLSEVAGRAEEVELVETVVRDLADARLLTTSADPQTGERWVDVSHEALIRGWPRLQRWLDEDRTALRVHRRITEAAEEWARFGRDDGALYRGTRLAEASEWQIANDALPNDLEREFLAASVALQDLEHARRERLRRRVTIASLAAAIIFLLLAAFSGLQRQVALEQSAAAEEQRKVAVAERTRAEAQRQVALARQLIAQAGSQHTPPDRALLLTLEANRLSSAADVRGGLFSTLERSNPDRTYLFADAAQAALAFSPDGQTIASGGSDGKLLLWDVASRKRMDELLQKDGVPVVSIAFSPDGRTLASGASDGSISFWDVATRAKLGAIQAQTNSVRSLAFSPDGETVAAGGTEGVSMWSFEDQALIGDPLATTGPAYCIAFSPDLKTLASGVDRGGTVLWDLVGRASIANLGGSASSGDLNFDVPITSVAFSPDGATLVSVDAFGAIELWDVTGRSLLYQLPQQHADLVSSVAFSSDGKILASGGSDGSIALWDVENRSGLGKPLLGHTDPVSTVAFSPDGSVLASAGGDGIVVLWDLTGRSALGSTLPGQKTIVNSVAFSPDGEMLAAVSILDASIWDVERGTLIAKPLPEPGTFVNSVAFSPDSATLAIGEVNGQIVFWDIAREMRVGDPLRGDTGRVVVAYSPDGTTIASGGTDGTIILWDVATRARRGQPLIGPPDHEVTSLTFSHDGKTLASSGTDGLVFLWNIAGPTPSGEPLATRPFSVGGVAFSSDSKTLVSAAGDGQVVFWDVASRARLGEPLRVDRRLSEVALSPDGSKLAVGGGGLFGGTGDGALVLLDVDARSVIGEPLPGLSASVTTLAFSPDGKLLASGDFSGATILWSIDADAWSATACRIANRNLSEAEWKQYLGDEPYHVTCP